VAQALLPAGSRLVSTLLFTSEQTPARVPAQQTKSPRHDCLDDFYNTVVLAGCGKSQSWSLLPKHSDLKLFYARPRPSAVGNVQLLACGGARCRGSSFARRAQGDGQSLGGVVEVFAQVYSEMGRRVLAIIRKRIFLNLSRLSFSDGEELESKVVKVARGQGLLLKLGDDGKKVGE
jgi:hypothetical protein